ncbi:LysE/ArgO family amino acid transporter [Micropruina sp.]|uniref:LysE/ArgO family amino acid transporter n=1 Tax=Micropruina sp. TaxID=2737536 RepID=UPI0039E62E8E
MLLAALAGLGLGFSLIVAIGAQNLFVLRQGLRREHVLLTAAICAASDAVLIVLGVSGVGLALQALPWLLTAVRWAGAVFLIGYGGVAARRAWRPSGEALAVDATPAATGSGSVPVAVGTRAMPVVLTCLALTWLNPHVYLDTVFLLGSVATSHGEGRWAFAAGAVMASVVWFFGLGLAARLLSPWLSSPRAWRVLDATIAVVMVAIAIGLLVSR